jgi:hypothetical protein
MPTILTALAAEAIVLASLATVSADVFAHKRVEQFGGVNVRGYRGAVLRQKRPSEIRVATTGGELAFGWGVAPSETMASYVRRLVALDIERSGSPLVVTSVNCAARGLMPQEYAGWVRRIAPLDPDVIVLVLDPPDRDAAGGDRYLPDRDSWFFTTFGYSPILPLVVKEKGALRHSRLLVAAGATLDVIDRAFSRTRTADASVDALTAFEAAARIALGTARRGVVVVVPSGVGDRAAYSEVADSLRARLTDSRVRVVDLGADPRLADPAVRLDGFHFSAAGHALAAERTAPPVVQLVR